MKVGPKYKLARKLGAAVFEKTQTAKFAMREQRKTKKFSRAKSNYGQQALEKQRVRFTYGITAKQIGNYARKAIENKKADPLQALFSSLEKRVDNIILRSGIAKTRYQAKQIVSHGHVLVNNIRTNIPSCETKIGDVISIKAGSKTKTLFNDLGQKMKEANSPSWLEIDSEKQTVTVRGVPEYRQGDQSFDLALVLQFFKR
jgi:small subunit ribosomal protein S4